MPVDLFEQSAKANTGGGIDLFDLAMGVEWPKKKPKTTPLLPRIGKLVGTTAETAYSLAEGATVWPISKTAGLAGLTKIKPGAGFIGMERSAPETRAKEKDLIFKGSAERAKRYEEATAGALTHKPIFKGAEETMGIVGKGFEAIETPQRMAAQELEKQGYGRSAYVLKFLSDLAMFKMLHAVGTKAKAKIIKESIPKEVRPTKADIDRISEIVPTQKEAILKSIDRLRGEGRPLEGLVDAEAKLFKEGKLSVAKQKKIKAWWDEQNQVKVEQLPNGQGFEYYDVPPVDVILRKGEPKWSTPVAPREPEVYLGKLLKNKEKGKPFEPPVKVGAYSKLKPSLADAKRDFGKGTLRRPGGRPQAEVEAALDPRNRIRPNQRQEVDIIPKQRQNLLGEMQDMGIYVGKDYNLTELHQYPDGKRVFRKVGRISLDDAVATLKDRYPEVRSADDLVEMVKSGRARNIPAPEFRDQAESRFLKKVEAEANAAADAELAEYLAGQKDEAVLHSELGRKQKEIVNGLKRRPNGENLTAEADRSAKREILSEVESQRDSVSPESHDQALTELNAFFDEKAKSAESVTPKAPLTKPGEASIVKERGLGYASKQTTFEFKPISPEGDKGLPASSKPRIRMETTGNIRASGSKVRGESEVASLLAHIRKSAQEEAYTVTTDKNGTILEIHRYSKGAKSAATIDPIEVAGRALSVDGAKKTYFVHNHPGLSTTPSPEDLMIADRLKAIFNLGNIETSNIVISGTSWRRFGVEFGTGKEIPIVPILRPKKLPVKERKLTFRGKPVEPIENSAKAIETIKTRYGNADGFVLVDYRNRPVGFLKYPKGESMKEGIRRLIAAAERQNARNIIFNSRAPIIQGSARGKFLTEIKQGLAGSIDLLDVVEQGASWLDAGKLLSPRSDFVAAIERMSAGPTLDFLGFQQMYEAIERKAKRLDPSIKKDVSKGAREAYRDVKKMADEYLGSISTRLGNIAPEIKNQLRRHEFEKRIKTLENTNRVVPMLKKVKAMSPKDKALFDISRKNADAKTLQALVKKYNMGKEYAEARKVLNEMYKEAKAAGFDVGFRKHFHPRMIKDAEGFLNYLMDKSEWPLFDKAIKEKEVKLGRYLEIDERAQVINTMLRGYKQSGITLSTPGQLKARKIKTIWPELNEFYYDSDAALLQYINKVTQAVSARKLFGKGENINDSIGHYVLDLVAKGKITPKNEVILRDILNARFNEKGTRGVVGMYKNLSYIDTMGSPISAITQIGDLAWALYKNGVTRTGDAIIGSVRGKSPIKVRDLGIDRIAQEFMDSSKLSKAVNTVFKAVGLEKIDFIGKEALINSTIKKARLMARHPKKLAALRAELEPIFGKETDSLIADLKAGRTSENVKLYAFNTLSDFQPITLAEMPQKYLTGGNGRIFYMLKTFTIKQFDVYRREVFQQIKKPGTRIRGIRNLVKLASCFVAANATADVIKSVILNRPLNLDDLLVDNILRLFGISKFVTWKAREEGLGSALVRQVAPPFKLIDAATKDIVRMGKGKKLETPASIPLVGKLYYWWFGRGAQKSAKPSSRGRLRKVSRISRSRR